MASFQFVVIYLPRCLGGTHSHSVMMTGLGTFHVSKTSDCLMSKSKGKVILLLNKVPYHQDVSCT